MLDNIGAAYGELPDEATQRRMAEMKATIAALAPKGQPRFTVPSKKPKDRAQVLMETATAAVQNHDLYKNPEYYTTGALQPMWTGGYHYQSPALAHTLGRAAASVGGELEYSADHQ